ncbi:uncharacterized protein LOC131597883 [Vicia villosa]|uniref:uncharacterized protein LOC131597883 n=1 Tax=Vicia villosa TaxID=3911 RepID=UPI00273B30DF|nr:uncharacterized protein LOC131597883 [Vicia villosa]
MKLYIKEQLQKIGYSKTTDMKPPSQSVKTKGTKKLKPTPNDNSTSRSPSYCDHVDKLFPDSQTPKSQKSQKRSNKGARISKLPSTPIPLKIPIIEEMSIPPKTPFIEKMPVFMHTYIERIVDVAGDDNCGYRTVSALLGNGEDSHTLVHHQLIQELKTHKEAYTRLYGEEVNIEVVNEALNPWMGAYAPVSTWMRFPEMGYPIACAYDMVCIDLMCYDFSETFFPLRTALPTNSNDRIICIGWLSKASHFVQVYLKPQCLIPLTSPKCTLHHTVYVETWSDVFVDRMLEFKRFNNIEKESNKEKYKLKPLIDLASDSSFNVFSSLKV